MMHDTHVSACRNGTFGDTSALHGRHRPWLSFTSIAACNQTVVRGSAQDLHIMAAVEVIGSLSAAQPPLGHSDPRRDTPTAPDPLFSSSFPGKLLPLCFRPPPPSPSAGLPPPCHFAPCGHRVTVSGGDREETVSLC